MPLPEVIKSGLALFSAHYRDRLGAVSEEHPTHDDAEPNEICLTSDRLRPGNCPKILHHGRQTADVMVLTHGLSDSPYYVEAIGRRFFRQGVNVILPLLPAHGLKDPAEAMRDKALDTKWKETIDNAVEVAAMLGGRISLGGFSTGGALGLNRILRRSDDIAGGLFLFSAAIDLGLKNETARVPFLQSIVGIIDGEIEGIGRDPYKYPHLPNFAGIELSQIIKENDRRWQDRTLTQPVFAAHSIHDDTVKIEGILDLLENHVEKGYAFIIAEGVSHSSLVLEADIEPDDVPGFPDFKKPKANPGFDWMMENAVRFFKEQVVARSK